MQMLLVYKIFVIKFVVDLTIFFVWKKASINYALQIVWKKASINCVEKGLYKLYINLVAIRTNSISSNQYIN